MINLLPRDIKAHIYAVYRRRRMTAAAMLVSIASLLGAASLAPSLIVIMAQEENAREAAQAAQKAERARAESNVARTVQAVNTKMELLAGSDAGRMFYPIIVDVLSRKPSGVSITGFFYQATEEGGHETLVVKGVASNRQALLAFRDAVGAVPEFSSTDLPISELVERQNIPFSLSAELER